VNLQSYRKQQLKSLTDNSGVYALCDLDRVPIYIGKSIDGIRTRVARHLTSARSDVIANRQLDVWEIAYVWAWAVPASEKGIITRLEDFLISYYHSLSPLVNGKIPNPSKEIVCIPIREEILVLPEHEIIKRTSFAATEANQPF
jgi:hypothetical protein